MSTNIIVAAFGSMRRIKTRPAWLIDHGMILKFAGLDLPATYEVHFSNSKTQDAKRVIGNADGVVIPDEYFLSGADHIYAWLYLSAGDNSGFTAYEAEIPLIQRPGTTDAQPDPQQTDIIEQAIAALNDAVEQTSADVESAHAAVEAAENAAEAAAASAQGVEQYATAARQAATEAANSASAAESSASDAQGAADNASASADRAEQAAASIEGDTERAEAAARTAQGAASDASGFAGTASTKATEAAGSAATAEQAAADALASATAAAGSASSASASATAAGNAQSAAETAQGKAEDAQEAAETAAQSIEDSAAQIDQNAEDILDLKSALNTKAGILRDTASGSVASFVPDATVPNLLGLSVALEPIQDLNGYDNPWPAGGGVNIFDPDTLEQVFLQDGYRWGHIFEETGTYALNAYAPTAGSDKFLYGVKRYSDESLSSVMYVVTPNRISPVIVSLNEGEKLLVYDGLGASTKEVAAQHFSDMLFQVAKASSQPEKFFPYSNICPISGWDSVELEAAGVNLFDKNAVETNKYLDANGNAVENSSWSISDYMPVNGSMIASGLGTAGNAPKHCYYDKAKQFISSVVQTNYTQRFTPPQEAKYIRLSVKTNLIDDIQLEVGSTATNYHPYAGNRYAIALGQTVYGGTLDVTAGTLTVDRAMVTLDGTQTGVLANWLAKPGVSGWLYPYSLTNNAISQSDTVIPAGLSCDTLPPITYNSAFAGTEIGIAIVTSASVWGLCVRYPSENYRTLADINALLSANPMTVVYKLATPIVIDLDPVQIATIANQTNNVWADAGDVTVEYAADLKTYIDNKIAAAVAALS